MSHPPSLVCDRIPEHPPSLVEVPYVPEPEYPEYLVTSDAETPLKDQPLPADASPTALSPGYVADSDPEEDPEEDHADYTADGGDDDDETSDDDDDDTDDEDEEPFEDEDDDEEEEEHLALAYSSAVPIVDPVPSAGDTEAFETDESAPTPRSPQIRIPFCSDTSFVGTKTYSLTTLPPPSSSLHVPPHVPTLLPLPSSPLPPLPVSLFIPLQVDHREAILEAELPPRKRLFLTALTSRYEVGESSTPAPRPTRGHGIDYGFIGTLDAKTRHRQTQLFQRVDGLVEDRQFHYETARLAFLVLKDWSRIGISLDCRLLDRLIPRCKITSIASQESLMTTLIAQVSSLQGQFLAALGHIRALQTRDQTHADDHEGAGSFA
ncbi:hypothetical protein Tco_0641399 [Tanacetum coccineum]